MRVLCVTDFPMRPPGYRWIWSHLPEQGDLVDFLWKEPRDSSAHWGKILTRYPSQFSLGLKAIKQARRKDYDLIVAWESKVGVPLAFLRRALGYSTPPLVILAFASGYLPSILFPLVRFALGAVDYVTVLTRSEIVDYQRRFALPPRKIGLGTHAVYDVRSATLSQTSTGTLAQQPFIHASGRTARDYATLFAAVDGLQIRLVAHGRNYNFEGLHVPPNVEVGDLVPREEYHQLVLHSLFEIVPLKAGVIHPAGSSQVITAMMMGRPVIATRTPSLEEFVEDGETGLLVEQGDARSMRSAIRHLLDHAEDRERMGMQARQRFEERYSFDAFARRTHEILRQVLLSSHNPNQPSAKDQSPTDG